MKQSIVLLSLTAALLTAETKALSPAQEMPTPELPFKSNRYIDSLHGGTVMESKLSDKKHHFNMRLSQP